MSKLMKLLVALIVIIFVVVSAGAAIWTNARRIVANGVNTNIEVLNDNFKSAQTLAVATKDQWEEEQSANEPNLTTSADVFKTTVGDIDNFITATRAQQDELVYSERSSLSDIATEFDGILEERIEGFSSIRDTIDGRVCQLEKLNTLISSFQVMSDNISQIDGQASDEETMNKIEAIIASLFTLKNDHTDYFECHRAFPDLVEQVEVVYLEDQAQIDEVSRLYSQLAEALEIENTERTEEINNQINEKGNLALSIQLDESYNQITILVSAQLSEMLEELNMQSDKSDEILKDIKSQYYLSS